MPEIDKINAILIFLGIPISLLLLIVVLLIVLWLYPQFRLVMGDFLKIFGKTSQWIRRKSLESEIEGSINLFTKEFNNEVSSPLLPQCSVEWVTPENAHSYVDDYGKAIIKVSFGEDRDTNYYNAANNFVERSFLPRAKTHLNKTISKAIDLLMLRNLLKRSRRTALNVFNSRFRDENSEIQERFYQCEETERKGIFKSILLQEYYFWGESLGEKVPSGSDFIEAEKFWDWFYKLATRGSEEMTELSFRSEHINTGVILVAHSETYDQFGNSPYVRRAFTYASNGSNCIYLLSRGKQKSKIVREVAVYLVSTGCFECLTKNPYIESYDMPNESPVLITCIALKPSYTNIIVRAWEELLRAMEDGSLVVGTVRQVFDYGIRVDIAGLLVEIEKKWLSSLKIEDAKKYFERNDELMLRVEECDQIRQLAILSNVDTVTDPKRILQEFEGFQAIPVDAIVKKIFVSNEGFETGILIEFPGKELKGYIPRSFATYSRFENLSEKYNIDSTVKVMIMRFDVRFKTLMSKVHGLEDPWTTPLHYNVGQDVEGIVRQISQQYVICELLPGIEGTVPLAEISWGHEDNKRKELDRLTVLQKVTAKIIEFDKNRKKLILSFKRITHSPTQEYYDINAGNNVYGTVNQVDKFYAIIAIDIGIQGYMHISEFMWNYCGDLSKSIQVGDRLPVILLSYDNLHDNIKVSRKRSYENNFDKFVELFKVGDKVNGIYRCCNEERIIFSVTFGGKQQVEGYVYKAEVSNIIFIDETNITNMFAPDINYQFIVKRIDERLQIVELSRKRYLRDQIRSIEYGETYIVKAIGYERGKTYFHGNELEGYLVNAAKVTIKIGENYNVIPAKIDYVTCCVEMEIV